MKSSPLNLAGIALLAATAGAFVGYQIAQSGDTDAMQTTDSDKANIPPTVSNNQLQPQPSATSEASDAIGAFAEPAWEQLSFRDKVRKALSYESHRKQAYAVELLFENMTSADAPDILSLLMEEPNERKRRGMLRPFFVKWGSLDGEIALGIASSLSGREKSDALSATLAGWGQSEPYDAWEAAKSYLDGTSPRQAFIVRGAFQELAKHDLHAAIAAVPDESNRMFGRMMNSALVQAAFDSDQVEGLLTHVLSMDDTDQSKQMIAQIFQRWGDTDTDAPVNALAQITDPQMAQEAMKGFMQGWMQTDREGALEYVLENRDDPLLGESLGHVLRGAFFEGGKSENEALAKRLVETGVIDEVARDVVGALSFNNPKLALDIASKVSDPDQQIAFKGQALRGWAHNNFDSAYDYYRSVESPTDRAKLASSLINVLPQRSDGAALLASIFSDLPTGDDRTKAVEQALGFASSPYARNNPEFLSALREIASKETDLGKYAREHYQKLFPSEG